MPSTLFIAMLVQVPMASAADWFLAACIAFSQQAAVVAVNAVWQGAFIACGLAICLRLVPRTSAEYRFAIWAAAFVTVVCLPFVTLIANAPAVVESAASFATPAGAAKPLLSIDTRWSLLIAALWAAATIYRALDLAIHSFRLRELWREAVPVDIESNLSDLLPATRVIWKRGPVEVCTTTRLQRPCVIGFFKPRIVIPNWLFGRLTPGELEQIVLHEAEHLRRHDDWTNLLQKLCLALFPLNPALVFIERRLCREREMACDDGVIEITHAPRAYATCLTSLAERGLERRAEALSLGAWQRRPELVHRVHSILRRKHTLGPLGTRALLGAFGCSLLFGSIELARCPQFVAFVPAHNLKVGPGQERAAVQASQQLASAKLPDASYIAPRSAAASRASSEILATEIDAIRAKDRSAGLGDAQASLRLTVGKQDGAAVGETPTYKPAPHSPSPALLMAQMPRPQAAAVQQQWVVLTTWEQMPTSNQDAGPTQNGSTADYVISANPETTTSSDPTNSAATMADGSVHSNAQQANQITITRLIFRFVPASSSASQPALVPMRAGWFVIQL